MIILLGLVVLVAAVVIGVAGVLANAGDGHALGGNFAVFGYHVTGSTGTLFLYGIVLGAAGLFGLSLLLAGARRSARRGRTARRDLKQSRHETAVASSERDDLAAQQQRETRPADAPAVSDRSPNDADPDRATSDGRGASCSGAARSTRSLPTPRTTTPPPTSTPTDVRAWRITEQRTPPWVSRTRLHTRAKTPKTAARNCSTEPLEAIGSRPRCATEPKESS